MSIKDVVEKIHNASSVQISISEDCWNLLGESASVVKLEGSPSEVYGEALSFISGVKFSYAKTVAIVLFCNPEDSFRMMEAIPTEEISATGYKALYSVCCEARTAGTVEMFIIYN